MTDDATIAANALSSYSRKGKDAIEGWFSRIDSEIFSALLFNQNRRGIVGATAEIGVHHGKSYVPLCLALKENEKSYCIDLFDDQAKNIDRSGKGDHEKFLNNLRRFGARMDNVVVVKGSSLDIDAKTIIQAVGRVRFFSVDGGHWHSVVKNDLDIALHSATDDYVIALDDFLHKEWPEVTTGFMDWHTGNRDRAVPLAISDGKLYLTDKAAIDSYRESLMGNRYLSFHYTKDVDLAGLKVPLFKGNPRHGTGKAAHYVRNYHPDLFRALKTVKHMTLRSSA